MINKNFQVYPAYCVTYRPGGASPDPLSRAGKDALKTFDEYKAFDFDREYKAFDFDLVKARHRMCFCRSRGVRHVSEGCVRSRWPHILCTSLYMAC